jgi:hypothetical protein
MPFHAVSQIHNDSHRWLRNLSTPRKVDFDRLPFIYCILLRILLQPPLCFDMFCCNLVVSCPWNVASHLAATGLGRRLALWCCSCREHFEAPWLQFPPSTRGTAGTAPGFAEWEMLAATTMHYHALPCATMRSLSWSELLRRLVTSRDA